MKLILKIVAFILFLCPALVKSQNSISIEGYEISNNEIALKIAKELMGEGVILESASLSKYANHKSFGKFQDENMTTGLKEGIILTSGNIEAAVKRPNGYNISNERFENQLSFKNHNGDNKSFELRSYKNQGDISLSNLLGKHVKTFDACVLEMDIIPLSDTISFNYVFMSEEYDEYVCSQFNDVFGFFISGEGIEGEINLATLPGTNTPVSINNVNGGNVARNNCPSKNGSFYVRNSNKIHMAYDGYTRLLEVKKEVTPYKSYHIKIAITDVADNALDSGVLIENQSIMSYSCNNTVYFEKNDFALNEYSEKSLQLFSDECLNNSTAKILVSGHTDADGDFDYNMELAKNRIEEVTDYLSSLGISKDRIITKVKGEAQPISNNEEEELMKYNRRVELKLLGDNEEYLSIQEQEIEKFKNRKAEILNVYPNPIKERASIEYFIPFQSNNAHLIVTNKAGKYVKKIDIYNYGEGRILLENNNYSSGLYFIHLVTNDEISATKKVIISK